MYFDVVAFEDVADELNGEVITGVEQPDEDEIVIHTLNGRAIKIYGDPIQFSIEVEAWAARRKTSR